MLINIDPTIIQKYLNPNKEKLRSKGVDSVVSRVTNLCLYDKTMNHDKLCAGLEKAFINHYKTAESIRTFYDYNVLEKIPKINELFNELKSKEWLYQTTPKFTNNLETRFDWGVVDCYFHVEKCK
jgi:lipoate-protein ligase A